MAIGCGPKPITAFNWTLYIQQVTSDFITCLMIGGLRLVFCLVLKEDLAIGVTIHVLQNNSKLQNKENELDVRDEYRRIIK